MTVDGDEAGYLAQLYYYLRSDVKTGFGRVSHLGLYSTALGLYPMPLEPVFHASGAVSYASGVVSYASSPRLLGLCVMSLGPYVVGLYISGAVSNASGAHSRVSSTW